jgi:uncharacterized protein (TIGR00251 family)
MPTDRQHSLQSSAWRADKDGVLLRVCLTPKASLERVGELFEHPSGMVIKASVRALPDKGKANQAIIKLLSKEFRRPKTSLDLVSGMQSRVKTVKFSGNSEEITKLFEKRFLSGGMA